MFSICDMELESIMDRFLVTVMGLNVPYVASLQSQEGKFCQRICSLGTNHRV